MPFFGFAVLSVSIFLSVIAIHAFALETLWQGTAYSSLQYANTANIETFYYAESAAYPHLANSSTTYNEITQLGSLDGIKVTALNGSLLIKTYSKPYAASAFFSS